MLSNPVFAETILAKSEILKKANRCFQDPQNQVCKELILQLEHVQLIEFDQNRFKCQSSILGLQTELIAVHFLNSIKKKQVGISIPYVINNC